MGCLTGTAFAVDAELTGKTFIPNEGLKGVASVVNQSLCGSAKAMTDIVTGNVQCIGAALTGSCHIICSVNKSSYLNVIPDVIWLSPEELASADFDIISNQKWIIN